MVPASFITVVDCCLMVNCSCFIQQRVLRKDNTQYLTGTDLRLPTLSRCRSCDFIAAMLVAVEHRRTRLVLHNHLGCSLGGSRRPGHEQEELRCGNGMKCAFVPCLAGCDRRRSRSNRSHRNRCPTSIATALGPPTGVGAAFRWLWHFYRVDVVRRRDFENDDEWRCSGCGRLLGTWTRSSHLHLRFANGHEYLVALPVVARCPKCHQLNERTEEERAKRDTMTKK